MPSLLFNPTPEAAAQIRERFTCPHSSLSNIAAEYDTTLDALCAWMATPAVQEVLRNNESQAAERTRQVASQRMHFAVEALIEMLAGYTHSERKVPMTASLAHIECRERQRANARRAAFLLHKLSRSYPPLPPAVQSMMARLTEPCDSSNVRRIKTVPVAQLSEPRVAAQPAIDAPTSPELPFLPVTALTTQPDKSLIGRSGTSRLRVAVATDIVPPSDFRLPTSKQLAPPTPALEHDIFTQLISHEPSPADEGFEPSPFNHGQEPARPPRLTEVCAVRSDISDLKSMSGPWTPRATQRTSSAPRVRDSS